jgi:hypothetical protein
MRTLADLPVVSCQLCLVDGIVDIASFQAGARLANWTNNEINVAIVTALRDGPGFDDVGVVLYQYCTDKSWL